MTIPVSVIIPFYQGHSTIGRALASVARQRQPPLEVIIVDDGSPRPFQPKSYAGLHVRVVRHEENRGIPSARNTGIAHARGEWVAFLDQDDEWRPRKLDRQWRLAAPVDADDPVVIYGRCRFEGEGHEPRGAVIPRPRSMRRLERGGRAAARELLSRGTVIPFVGLLVHRSTFDRLGRLDERLTGGSDDAEMLLRLAAEGYIFRSSDGYREHSAVHHYTGGNYSDPLRWTRDEEMYLPRLAERYAVVREHQHRAWFRIRYRNGRYHHRAGRRAEARAAYGRAARLRPLDPRPWIGLAACNLPRPLDQLLERATKPLRTSFRIDRG